MVATTGARMRGRTGHRGHPAGRLAMLIPAAQRDLPKMKSIGGGNVEIRIGVTHVEEAPQKPDGVIGACQ